MATLSEIRDRLADKFPDLSLTPGGYVTGGEARFTLEAKSEGRRIFLVSDEDFLPINGADYLANMIAEGLEAKR